MNPITTLFFLEHVFLRMNPPSRLDQATQSSLLEAIRSHPDKTPDIIDSLVHLFHTSKTETLDDYQDYVSLIQQILFTTEEKIILKCLSSLEHFITDLCSSRNPQHHQAASSLLTTWIGIIPDATVLLFETIIRESQKSQSQNSISNPFIYMNVPRFMESYSTTSSSDPLPAPRRACHPLHHITDQQAIMLALIHIVNENPQGIEDFLRTLHPNNMQLLQTFVKETQTGLTSLECAAVSSDQLQPLFKVISSFSYHSSPPPIKCRGFSKTESEWLST